MSKKKRPALPPMSEEAFLQTVLELARLRGWKSAHFRPARTGKGWRTPCQGDAEGWPDLVLVRRDRILAAEIKREGGKLTEAQARWLAALEAAGVPVYLWRPNDLETIAKVLE